jgi:extradiol dioxygenase family protein
MSVPNHQASGRVLDPFHLAIGVHDLAAARSFYGELLGCTEGRHATRWVDFDLFGHQLTCHLRDGLAPSGGSGDEGANDVDGDRVPIPHFGVVLSMDHWRVLADRLADAGVDFLLPPRVRFRGRAGEQATFFLRDPSGNALEFKAMADPRQLFGVDEPAGR